MVRNEGLGANFASRDITAQLLPARPEILNFAAFVRRAVERRVGQLVVVDGDAKARTEFAEFVLIEFLLLVGNVSTFTAFAEAIAFNRAGKDYGGRARMLDSRSVRGINLSRVVAALAQCPQGLVWNILDHFQQ